MSWDKVEAVLPYAKSIAFDGCHKIYVLMDDQQTKEMYEYGYNEGGSTIREMGEFDNVEQALAVLHGWYDESCGLQFIHAVRTVPGDPSEGFDNLINQFEFEDEDEYADDEYEEEWYDDDDL